MKRPHAQRGMTLIEVLVSAGLLVGGGGALLVGMSQGVILVDYLGDQQVAMNAAQGKLAELAQTSFDTLAAGAEFNGARDAAGVGQRACLGEDANCNGVIDGTEVDLDGDGVDQLLPGGWLTIRIRPIPGEAFGAATRLDLHVAASWVSRSRCIGGEDRNCNGLLDAGEDTDGDGWMDSPVMVSTRIATQED